MEGEIILVPGFCYNRVTDFACYMWILPKIPPPGVLENNLGEASAPGFTEWGNNSQYDNGPWGKDEYYSEGTDYDGKYKHVKYK